MATGRPGCGPRSGLTRPSLGPGTIYTVSPRGFPTPSRPRASVIRTSMWRHSNTTVPCVCVDIDRDVYLSLSISSSHGDVQSSPITYGPARSGAAAAQTPATSTARDADFLLDAHYVFGQNITEYNPALSPSGPRNIHLNSPPLPCPQKNARRDANAAQRDTLAR